MAEPALQPPLAIKQAIRCIWASFVTTILSWLSLFFTTAPEHIVQMAQKMKISVNTLVIMKLCVLAGPTAIIVFFVLRRVAKGQNWARIVCLIMGIIALPDAVYRFMGYHNAQAQMISIVVNAVYLGFGYCALYLMFTAPGKDWFKKEQSVSAS